MTAEEKNKMLRDAIYEKLTAKVGKDCVNFLTAYGHFIELYDDYIDRDKGEISIHTVKDKLVDLLSSNYWRDNATHLYLVEKLIQLQFADVVKWEQSDEEWMRRDAKALSHCGYNILFAIVILELGIEEAEKFSSEYRKTCHEIHKDDVI
jgi:hypothetical protein